MKSTLITLIYNEEYLLPFWLNHHKKLFDDIIIIDYNSTDNSIEICKNICPNAKIINSKNKYYGNRTTDLEIMEIENSIEGIKLVLNITEFLFLKNPIKHLFNDNDNDNDKKSYKIIAYTPYSSKKYEINDNKELISNLLNDDVVFNRDINHSRDIHNYSNGNYIDKRKGTNNITYITNDVFIIWFGFYPMNEKFIQRKLEIKNKILENDKKNNSHHFNTINQINDIINNNINNSMNINIKILNNDLYNIISMMNNDNANANANDNDNDNGNGNDNDNGNDNGNGNGNGNGNDNGNGNANGNDNGNDNANDNDNGNANDNDEREIKYDKNQLNLAFVTYFYGSANNISYLIPEVPSNKYNCYYYTNNKDMIEKLKNTKWISVFDNKITNDDLNESSMASKHIKAMPQDFKLLRKYDYICSYDNKLQIIENVIENLINNELIKNNYAIAIREHKFVQNNVWCEFALSMLHERYRRESEKTKTYIYKQIANGLSETTKFHYENNILIRNMRHPKMIEFNETWYSHIKECGIECQIALFFVKQLFPENFIFTIR